jgi:uncharacterized protein (DUF58 family)
VTVEPSSFPGFSEEFLRELSLRRFKPKPGVAGRGAGEHLVRKGGASVEFSDFRTYSLGDDFRLIDWNSFARLDKPFVKVYRDEEGIALHFLLDATPSMDYGEPNKFLFARRLMAALAFIAFNAFNWVKAETIPPEDGYPLSRGRHHILPFFRFLESLKVRREARLSPELTRYAQSHVLPSLIILLTDALDPLGVEGGILQLLAQGHEVVFLHILAPEEVEPRLRGDWELEDKEWKTRLEVSLDEEGLSLYRRTFQSFQEGLKRFSLGHQVAYLPLLTSLDLKEVLFRLLPRAGILK